LANAVVGFWEEHQAGNAIAALKAKLAIKARVKRDGKWITPAARELVPGDVIRVRLGDIVPADARLLAGDPVEVDQSGRRDRLKLEGAPIPHGQASALMAQHGVPLHLVPHLNKDPESRTTPMFETVSSTNLEQAGTWSTRVCSAWRAKILSVAFTSPRKAGGVGGGKSANQLKGLPRCRIARARECDGARQRSWRGAGQL
jgi:hypothetical protein